MEYLFYLTALLCAYSYFLYPLLLKITPCRELETAAEGQEIELPRISLVITAHNEAGHILEKLENTLEIDYPADLLEVIVASDCSTDATDDIVQSYSGKGVRLVRANERKGKEYAQLCAIRVAAGTILVFSDVGTRIPAGALRVLAREFAGSRVGAVSSEDRFISSDGRVVGEGAYVRYEMWLRRLESCRAGVVGLSGSFFAARREICEAWDIYSPSDFNTALNCAKHGLVAVSCPDVVGIYRDVAAPGLEYQRKMRTVIRGISALARHPEVLNPFVMGGFAFQVWSHKIMRWAVPWFMLAFAVLTVLLLDQGLIYWLALAAQGLFYLLALAGWLSGRMRQFTLVRLVYFFVQTNLALAQATLAFIMGRRMTVWTPSSR